MVAYVVGVNDKLGGTDSFTVTGASLGKRPHQVHGKA